jgi:hypothetical protein
MKTAGGAEQMGTDTTARIAASGRPQRIYPTQNAVAPGITFHFLWSVSMTTVCGNGSAISQHGGRS